MVQVTVEIRFVCFRHSTLTVSCRVECVRKTVLILVVWVIDVDRHQVHPVALILLKLRSQGETGWIDVGWVAHIAAQIISRTRMLFKKGTPQWDLVDINEIIREMVSLMRSEVTQHSISVRTELAENIPQITGDRVQLQQVFMNLMINAIDAMKDMDGTRDLTISSLRAENEQLMVSIKDTGVGIPPQQADQIFNAFFTTKPHGTGMGLRISRSIVESHGGRLWAASNSPHGASFHLTLPTRVEARE
jgi:signal transduction histidine kinase